MHAQIRSAVRHLLNSPGFTLTAVVGLAVGIGATAECASWVPARRATRIDHRG